MRKPLTLLLICFVFLLIMGFENQKDLTLTQVETTVIKTDRILRYDFKIKNVSNNRIESKFDYPGHHHYGIEVVVRPHDKLASLMEMQKNTKYQKMQPRGSGASGMFNPGQEAAFHNEYQIKDNVDFQEVKKYALDATLVILDGTNVIAEIPLKNN